MFEVERGIVTVSVIESQKTKIEEKSVSDDDQGRMSRNEIVIANENESKIENKIFVCHEDDQEEVKVNGNTNLSEIEKKTFAYADDEVKAIENTNLNENESKTFACV